MGYYEEAKLSQGKEDLTALSGDTSQATAFGDTHLADLGRQSGGIIYSRLLEGHSESITEFQKVTTACGTLYTNAATRTGDTITAYADTESDNVDQTKKIWEVLQSSDPSTTIGPPSAGSSVARGPLPSEGLEAPETVTDHWIWNVLSWPDYLSVGSWLRKAIDFLVEQFTGHDLSGWLWEWLGGDFKQIEKVGNAWQELADYFSDSAEELSARMSLMFAGWYDSADADTAGSYFAAAVEAIGSVSEPLGQLAAKYRDVAFSSFGFFQAVYSALDAAVDALVVFLMGGVTVLEALAALFTGGATAVPASATAIIAAVEAVSAAWGFMMMAVYGIMGVAALIGAASIQIEWVSVPAG